MLHTLTLNPLIAIQICAVAQTAVMAVLVTARKQAKPTSKRSASMIEFLERFGYCTLGVLAVVFLDTGIAWLAGAWGYADWRYQLPSAVLLVVAGAEYILAGLLKRGSWVSLLFLAGAALTIALFLHVYVAAEVVMGPLLEGGLPVVLGVLVGAGLLVAGVETARAALHEGRERKARLSWDISPVMDKVFNRWTNLVIWALAVVHGILLFSGYSLLTFWVP
ncbi:MAG: hypothetical protein Q6373_004110 [Candidatus Sigynarchaeota archaeon]